MKKKLSLITLVLALSISLLMPAWAAGVPQLAVAAEQTSVEKGDSFSVFIQLENNPGFESLQVDVLFDTALLSCTKVKAADILTQDGILYAGNKDNDGKATFAAINVDPIEGDGDLVELTFLALKSGNVDITARTVRMISDNERVTAAEDTQNIEIEAPALPPEEKPEEEPETPEVEIPAEPSVVDFSDVPTTHWAYTYIKNAVSNGLFSGIGNNQFGPALNVTRGMFVTTLYSCAGSPDVELSNFSDVAPTAWYAKAVAWASQQGIVSGIGNNKFGPDMPITREQIALILFNYADGVSPGTEMFVRMAYPDAKDIHDWALTAFTWAMNKELISGKSGNILDPLATATRAEVAVIMQNFVNLSK